MGCCLEIMGTRQGITHFQTSAFPPFESEGKYG